MVKQSARQIPPMGFGTADLGGDVSVIVEAAIRAGYRLIDTARIYGSEEGIGKAVAKCIAEGVVTREELFIQTKLDPARHSDQGAMSSLQESLNAMGLDYVDQYLIHWPVPRGTEADCYERNRKIWQAFEALQREGKTRLIGVCNFLERHLLDLMDHGTVKPAVNQLELHPAYQQRGLVRFCRQYGLQIEAWSPMGRGVLKTPEFEAVARKYGKDTGQLALRWSIQNGFVPISRSSTSSHIGANLEIFDFVISEEDMELLNSLNTNDRHLDIWGYKRQQMY